MHRIHMKMIISKICRGFVLLAKPVKGKFTQKIMLNSDKRFDKIEKNAVDLFSNITSGSQDICIESEVTNDMEAAVLICK